VDDKKRKHIVGMLQRPDKREQAEKSLKSRKIPSYEEWKKSKGQTPAATPAARAAPAAGGKIVHALLTRTLADRRQRQDPHRRSIEWAKSKSRNTTSY
jgi:hypothetical protein